MPIVEVSMTEGQSDDRKALLIRRITDAVMEAISAPEENVTVLIQEIPMREYGVGGVGMDLIEP